MRIALAGTGRLGVGLLRALLSSSHEVVAIVQDGRRTRSLWRWIVPVVGRWRGGSSIAGWSKRRGIPLIWIDRMDERDLARLRALDIDVLLVGNFFIILKQPLLDLPRIGCVNTHPSLLPRHRGPTPYYAAILSGDLESGVTFHVMEPGIDTGPILHQPRFLMDPHETVLSLQMRSCELAEQEVVGVLDRIAAEGLRGVPQEVSQATYVRNPTAAEAWLDWNESAESLDRKVRAMCPHLMPRFMWRGKLILVGRSHWEVETDSQQHTPGTVLGLRPLRVATGSGVFVIEGAFVRRPFYWWWPNPWQKVIVGKRLE